MHGASSPQPGNIMISANEVAKIGDLGIAKIIKHTMAKTQIGTPHCGCGGGLVQGGTGRMSDRGWSGGTRPNMLACVFARAQLGSA